MTTTKTYRVATNWPMVQVNSQRPGVGATAVTGRCEQTERTFYAGDVLPGWLAPWEIEHLLGLRAIEEVKH